MKRAKRRAKSRIPDFPPVERLVMGKAFNPYRVFVARGVRHAILSYPKLRPGAKLVWLMLADQCYVKGFDWHSQRNLAHLVGLSLDQLWRHLDRLRRARLVHIAHDLGRSNRTWLLFHPVFARCSPLTPSISAVPLTAEMQEGLPQERHTQRKDQRKDAERSSVTLNKATSYRGQVAPNGEDKAKVRPLTESPAPDFRERIDCQLEVNFSHTPGWYSLTPLEKQNRADELDRVTRELLHFQTFLSDKNPAIVRQARREVHSRIEYLSARGALPRARKWKGEP